jgi:hypothetical protein
MSRSLLILVALLACSAVALAQDDCGGNCPSQDCPGCPCGYSTNYQDIGGWCSQYGGWDQGQCQCIVNAESSGNANADNYNPGGNTYDVGMAQVNTINWSSCSGGNPPCDPSTNLNCAIDVWRWGGGSFKLWSTCGGCGACDSSVSSEWDGSFPKTYDPSRPFPFFAVNATDSRVAEHQAVKILTEF